MIHVTSAQLAAWIGALWWPFLRALAMLNSAPVFSSSDIPKRIKIGLALSVALLIQPLLPTMPAVNFDSISMLVLSLQQILVGVALGFSIRIVFSAVNFTGALIGLQMGLGFASLIDPKNGVQVPTLSSFLGLFATLIFLAINGQLFLLEALAQSFRAAPPALAWHMGPHIIYALAKWGGELFLLGVVMSLPVLTVLMITNLALGVLAKVSPQLNIFVVGFPVLLMLGLLGLYLIAPLLGHAMNNAFGLAFQVTGALVAPTH